MYDPLSLIRQLSKMSVLRSVAEGSTVCQRVNNVGLTITAFFGVMKVFTATLIVLIC